MKTSKKILLIITSLGITSGLSAALAGGISMLGYSFWLSYWFLCAFQIICPIIWNRYYETRNIINLIKEYNAKPYKKYEIPLDCANCGSKNNIEIDLTETEFRCTNCQKFNGIHVSFMTAVITEPIITE